MKPDTLIILSPAFPVRPEDHWLPFQTSFIRTLNREYPSLKIVVLAFHFPLVPERRHQWEGNTIITFSGGMKGKLHSLLLWRKVWRELQRLRDQCHIIGLFSLFCSEGAFIGHYFARRYNLLHRIWILGQDARAQNNQVRRIRPEAEELVASSDFLADEFSKSHGIMPAYRIPLGIFADDFPPTATKTIDLIGVGSLVPLKQYHLFLDCIALLKQERPGLKAVIVGEGASRPELEAQIHRLGIGDQVQLAGPLPHGEVLQLLQQSRILLHPSSYEGFSMANKEALYAGAHVISFCRPMDETIPHFHLTVDVPGMAAQAAALLDDPGTAYTPVLYYSMKDTATAILQLFGYPDR